MVADTVYLEHPVISAGRTYAAVYDAGGSALRLLSGKKVVFSLDLPDDRCIYSARLNDAGYLALTADENGYKASVKVFDDKQKQVFQWNSSSRYVTDAAVSEDSTYMAAVTIGQEEPCLTAGSSSTGLTAKRSCSVTASATSFRWS
jgi:hypothetical protein